ncbi:MAG: hypothetical protein MK320_10750 [Gammaproteobacteria bacterium]|nr:hypothetical protein [Gammaproteobacteria bacterium]
MTIVHFIETLRRWVGALTDLGLVLIALGVILQILFGSSSGAVPFLPVDIIGSVVGLVKALGAEGLVGLVALGIIAWTFNRQSR